MLKELSDDYIKEEVREFLKNSKLSNYEIQAYLTLLSNNNLTARELSKKSKVPTGRIYEILEELKIKGLIEISESRPKIYKSINPSLAFNNLITYLTMQDKKKTTSLIDQAKYLESKIVKYNLFPQKKSSKIFWSTAYGTSEAFSLYNKRFKEARFEILMTGFIDKNTIKVIKFGKPLFDGVINALKRRLSVYYLWSFEYDKRNLLKEEILKNQKLYDDLMIKLEELYKFSSFSDDLSMKFILKRMPTYFDIFDEKRVIIKLQNPLNPARIFACLDVLDPNLASELREKYFSIWRFEAQ